ncbi:hypothetical protein [Streptomyces curacoi]|uniref:Signal protein n=1 Tax=Streptomyces curacoi TaxID=146536 RepID=A0A117PHN2_9ACTN|nr:hypothetical protein [Streptomyces curacoi]KUM79804.1 signal protein [Streptomyces curacoi]
MKVRTGGAALVTMALAALVGCGGSPSGGSEGSAETETEQASAAPGSAAPASAQARLSPADLQSRWWTWAMSEPERTNPVADEDGSECARNQPQDVWFLAGTFGTRVERTCGIPAGVPVAVPLVNLMSDPADCADFMSTAKGSAVLDGEKVDSEIIRGEAISVQGVAGNPVTGTDERFAATGCGLWVQLPPLERGKHTLAIRGQAQDFSVAVDYSLTVGAA